MDAVKEALKRKLDSYGKGPAPDAVGPHHEELEADAETAAENAEGADIDPDKDDSAPDLDAHDESDQESVHGDDHEDVSSGKGAVDIHGDVHPPSHLGALHAIAKMGGHGGRKAMGLSERAADGAKSKIASIMAEKKKGKV